MIHWYWGAIAIVALIVIYKLPRWLSLLVFCAIGVLAWVFILRQGFDATGQLTDFMNGTFNKVIQALGR